MDGGRSNEMTMITTCFMWFVIIALLLLFGCAGRKYTPYFPKMIIINKTSYDIQACRYDEGTIICEYDLEFFKDDTFYCFPKSEFERAEP